MIQIDYDEENNDIAEALSTLLQFAERSVVQFFLFLSFFYFKFRHLFVYSQRTFSLSASSLAHSLSLASNFKRMNLI